MKDSDQISIRSSASGILAALSMGSMSRVTGLSVTISIGLCSVGAYGHHGWVAHYDRDSYVRVEGTVREIEFVDEPTAEWAGQLVGDQE